jgi:hypothetical protein
VPLASAIERNLQRLALDLAVVLDALQLCRVLRRGELRSVLCLDLHCLRALLCSL